MEYGVELARKLGQMKGRKGVEIDVEAARVSAPKANTGMITHALHNIPCCADRGRGYRMS